MTELSDAVARASWSSLLPAHRATGEDQPVGSPRQLDALQLADDRWVVLVGDETGRVHPTPLVVTGSGVRRARAGDGAGEALMALLGGGSRQLGAFTVTSWHTESVAGERSIDVDQTNESVVVGEQAVLKWSFRAEEGPHPAPAVLAELDRQRFTGTPRPWGLLEWRPEPGAARRLLASVVALVPGAVDGWTWAVADLRASIETADDTRVHDAGTRVGELVAGFHLALAGTARRASSAEVSHWRTGAHADLERALGSTSGPANEVLARHADAVRRAWDDATTARPPVLRVHGDLHVGQVLRAGTGATATYVVTDFDGNPVAPAPERSREQPAAVDVAGMVQSMRHAGLVLRRHEPALDPSAATAAADAMVEAFLRAYTNTLTDAGRRGLFEDRQLRPFCLQQVCREFTYAATHLPRWSYVPEAALPALATEGAAG